MNHRIDYGSCFFFSNIYSLPFKLRTPKNTEAAEPSGSSIHRLSVFIQILVPVNRKNRLLEFVQFAVSDQQTVIKQSWDSPTDWKSEFWVHKESVCNDVRVYWMKSPPGFVLYVLFFPITLNITLQNVLHSAAVDEHGGSSGVLTWRQIMWIFTEILQCDDFQKEKLEELIIITTINLWRLLEKNVFKQHKQKKCVWFLFVPKTYKLQIPECTGPILPFSSLLQKTIEVIVLSISSRALDAAGRDSSRCPGLVSGGRPLTSWLCLQC